MELESLQIYWWLLISVLGAILVFLLFVQGGQTFLLGVNDSSEASRRMISSFGHKWELSFTTLVVFGGAFFASFQIRVFFPAILFHELRRSLLALDAHSHQFRASGGEL